MSTDVPVQLLVAAFQEEKAADAALDELKAAKWAGLIGIKDAAVIRKDQKGKLHIKETGDMGGGKGAVIGGVVGATLGLLTGPIGAVALAGGVIGGLAAKLRDGGFPDSRLKQVGASLEPGTSAIVAVVEHRWVADLQQELEDEAKDVFVQTISADIAAQLHEGREVTYSALEADGNVLIEREAIGEDVVDYGAIASMDEGIAAGHVVATAEGVAAERVSITDDATTYEVAAADAEDVVYAAAVATDEGVAGAAIAAHVQSEDEEEAGSEAEGDTAEEEEKKA
jgi:uncharacterized membrane protein